MSNELEKPSRPPVAPVSHELRRADEDPRVARRVERQISNMFIVSALSAVGFVVSFVAIDPTTLIGLPVIGSIPALNLALGLTLGLSILMIGTGAIHWARKLMPDTEVVEERHTFASEPADIDTLSQTFDAGIEESGFLRRRIVRRTLLGAMALFPIPVIVSLRDLGPSPADKKFHTVWRTGMRLLTDVSDEPIRAADVPIGTLINAVPEGLHEVEEEQGTLNERAKAVIVVVRIDPKDIRSQQGGTAEEPWDYNGILAFSKICTHLGCPISLYQHRTHHLLCPCHQSTYDLADSGRVIFGPASRRMPQLGLTVDTEGYLIARGDFAEPVGPSFWELG